MKEMSIERHNFELAKNRLKEFSEKTETELEINKVRTNGNFFGLGDHKVTGEELNRRLETIQNNFISINTTNNKVIKEFKEVYNALDALDRDYITSIVANVKAIEKTSNDIRVQQRILKQHNEKLVNQQSKLDLHQTEIKKNVENISKIVMALKIFKEKLESYKHLTDIDKIWNNYKSIQNEIRVVSDSIRKFSKKTTEDIATANNKNKILLEQINRDIFTLNTETKSFKKFLSDLSEKVGYTTDLLNDQILIIQEIFSFVEQLKNISHLNDIDRMWENIEENTSQLIEYKKIDEELAVTIQKNKDEVDKNISYTVQATNVAIESLTKKVKYAYWIAGSSIGFVIIEFILLLTKVI